MLDPYFGGGTEVPEMGAGEVCGCVLLRARFQRSNKLVLGHANGLVDAG